MAIDRAILTTSIRQRRYKPIVRFYGWTRPSLSIGANQLLPRQVVDRCMVSGIDLVRRPTGGGAVLHDGDLTYCLVAPYGNLGVLQTYRWIAEGLIAGFASLGLTAGVVHHRGTARAAACFAQPTGADLEIAGRKICGSAQVRKDGWLLQHGSIPLVDVRSETRRLLGHASVDDSASLHELAPGIGPAGLAERLTRGFSALFEGPPLRRELDAIERREMKSQREGLSNSRVLL